MLPRSVIVVMGAVAGISVALNLFVAGAFLGGRFHGPPSPPDFERRLSGYWKELPQDDQGAAQAVIAGHRDDVVEKWRADRAAAQQVSRLLHQPDFDEAGVKAAFDLWNQRALEFRAAMQSLLLDMASKISPEGRTHLRGPMGGP
jgi:uncharacterized membrane protein